MICRMGCLGPQARAGEEMERSEEGRMLLPAWEENKGSLPGGSDIRDRAQKVSRAWL